MRVRCPSRARYGTGLDSTPLSTPLQISRLSFRPFLSLLWFAVAARVLLSLLRQNARDVQRHPVEGILRGHIKRFSIFAAPRHVMWMLRRQDGPQVFSRRGNNPQTAGSRNIQVALLVDFDSVDRIFTRSLGHVKKHLPVGK